jgi:hypothetical protein
MGKSAKLEQQDAQKKAAAQARLAEFMAKDYSTAKDFNQLWSGISTEEIVHLRGNCQSFQDAENRLNLVEAFRKFTSEEQERFFAECNEGTRQVLENDGYVSSQTQTLAPSPDESEEESAAQRQAKQEFLNTQSSAAAEAQDDKLYPGVEIIGGKYRLSLDPGDGSQPEVFWGDSQKDVFIKLRESKVHATKALRRRQKEVKVTQELRDLKPDVVNYPPLEVKVTLSPSELFDATEMMKDPTTAVEGARRLAAAARTQEDVDRANEITILSRQREQEQIAHNWMSAHPEFYQCKENIQAMIDLMTKLNWAAISNRNLDLAFKALQEQGILVEQLPETEVTAEQVPQPRKVFVPQAAPVAAPKVTPAPPVRPTSRKPLNNSSMGGGETSFVRRNTTPAKPIAMTPSEYHSISAVELKTRYHRDEAFKARVDAYWDKGGR